MYRGNEIASNALAEQPYVHNSEVGNKTYNAVLVGIVPFAISVHVQNAQAAIALCDADARGTLRFQVFDLQDLTVNAPYEIYHS